MESCGIELVMLLAVGSTSEKSRPAVNQPSGSAEPARFRSSTHPLQDGA